MVPLPAGKPSACMIKHLRLWNLSYGHLFRCPDYVLMSEVVLYTSQTLITIMVIIKLMSM